MSDVVLLVADDDPLARAVVRATAEQLIEGVVVLEAEDGAEAIRLGLQRRPSIALFDVNMPRLGGIEAAVVLRDLVADMPIALQSGERARHEERARSHGLVLFDKLSLERALRWLARELAVTSEARLRGAA